MSPLCFSQGGEHAETRRGGIFGRWRLRPRPGTSKDMVAWTEPTCVGDPVEREQPSFPS